jgi:hypothetical protein
MHFSLSLPTGSPWPAVSIGMCSDRARAEKDPCWKPLVARLQSLRKSGRRSVRIVDVNCGDGSLLIAATREARKLGFLAIEGSGVDPDADNIDDARRQARWLSDCAIGLEFEKATPMPSLLAEAEFPADIILYAPPPTYSKSFEDAVRAAGRHVLAKREQCGMPGL